MGLSSLNMDSATATRAGRPDRTKHEQSEEKKSWNTTKTPKHLNDNIPAHGTVPLSPPQRAQSHRHLLMSKSLFGSISEFVPALHPRHGSRFATARTCGYIAGIRVSSGLIQPMHQKHKLKEQLDWEGLTKREKCKHLVAFPSFVSAFKADEI